MNGFDVQWIAPEKASCQCVMDVSFHCAGAVEGLTEADNLAVGVNANPEDIREFLSSQSFNCCDFHGRPLKPIEFPSSQMANSIRGAGASLFSARSIDEPEQ